MIELFITTKNPEAMIAAAKAKTLTCEIAWPAGDVLLGEGDGEMISRYLGVAVLPDELSAPDSVTKTSLRYRGKELSLICDLSF